MRKIARCMALSLMILPLFSLYSNNAASAAGNEIECYQVNTNTCPRGEAYISGHGATWCCYSYNK